MCFARRNSGADPRQLARINLFAVMSDVGWTLWAHPGQDLDIDYEIPGTTPAAGPALWP